jgi:oligoendopeptidase F
MGKSAPLVWNLDLLEPATTKLFHKKLEDSLAIAVSFREKYRGTIASLNAAELLAAIKEYEAVQQQALKPQYYAHLLFAADSTSDLAKSLSQKASEAGNRLSRELLFFDLEIMSMPDQQCQLLLSDSQLAEYHHYLNSIRKFSKHTLPEREEQLLKQKDLTGSSAFTRLFDEVSSSFTFQIEIDGKLQEMTGEELLGLLHHPDAAIRERSFTLFLERHGEQRIIFSAVFNNMALDHAQEMELRGYNHPMEPTNLGNELSDDVVERLMSITEANYPLAQDYFRLKAKLLGIGKLKNTDIYAPVAEAPRSYSLDEAKNLVLAAYQQFNPAYQPILEAFFAEGRIDTHPRPGKSGGAFCMGITPDIPPFVLLNHTGNLRDVATLAHELGHGLHFVLAGKQSLINYHAPLPLAETASVFGELLLTRHLLASEQDRSVKISLLCAKIEDIIATTFRQVVLTRFEERLHLERLGGLLSDSRICEIWLEENGKLFGNTVDAIDAYRWGWSYISHFIHTRFYCYAYTFAEILVLALYKQYLAKGASFLPEYEAILVSGGSRSPADTAALAGIDLDDPTFWQQGYDILAELIAELKTLVG